MLTRVLTCGSVPGGSTAIVIVHRRRAGAPAISDSTPLEQTSMSSTHALMPNDMVLLCLKMRQTHLRLSPDRQTCPLKGVTRNIIRARHPLLLDAALCIHGGVESNAKPASTALDMARARDDTKVEADAGARGLVGLCEVKAPCPPEALALAVL